MGLLKESGKALFFPVANAEQLNLEAPALRLGDAVRTHVRSLSVMQKEALVISSRTGSIWRLASDEGAYLDGDDEAPCPLSFLTTGMVSSYMDEILARARIRGIEIGNLCLVQDNYYTMKGSALRGTMTGRAKDIELEAQIESTASQDELTALVMDATAASPLSGLTRGIHESLFSLRHNDTELACEDVRQIDGEFLAPAADAVYEQAEAAAGDWSGLIRRAGPSPKTAATTSSPGSSLAEQQDRILHIRGICTLRDDGVKQIEQQLINPHGSIFHYLSDEPPENGGSGAAPDALTYFSAGIGFCFMTQFGRYAKITRKDLHDYRILQDTHFSLGGATGNTGEAGTADPIETHVDLVSGEDDSFARAALAMSEQTCFLHALCRTDLKTRVRLTPYREAVSGNENYTGLPY